MTKSKKQEGNVALLKLVRDRRGRASAGQARCQQNFSSSLLPALAQIYRTLASLYGNSRKPQTSELRNCSRSAINPGPIGSHLSFLFVCALEAGMSWPANIASQPK